MDYWIEIFVEVQMNEYLRYQHTHTFIRHERKERTSKLNGKCNPRKYKDKANIQWHLKKSEKIQKEQKMTDFLFSYKPLM